MERNGTVQGLATPETQRKAVPERHQSAAVMLIADVSCLETCAVGQDSADGNHLGK